MTKDVVCLRGGLGNQLFQVAFATWLAELSRREVAFDVSCVRSSSLPILRLAGLGDYVGSRVLGRTRYWPAIEGRLDAVASAVRRAHGPLRLVVDNDPYGPADIDARRPAWWFGYWQRDRYARALLPHLLAATGAVRKMDRPTIGIHVRRGDMVDKPTAVPAEWFLAATAVALRSLSSAPDVRVWSDEPDWCAAHLDIGHDFAVARDGDVLEQLSDLASCDALVISRSTYSWWAARLATERGATVVYPAPWAHGTAAGDDALIPESWRPVLAP